MKAQIIAATGLLFALRAHAQATLDTGTGFGTYYYDIEQVEACSDDFGPQNTGPVECNTASLTLDQIDSNYLVAMNHSQLIGDIGSFCGKKVVVSVNGVASDLPLFIGDGCQRCGTGSSSSDVWDPNGAPGLDFSFSVLSELSSSACTDGHISITWEIVDETLYNFDTNAPGSAQGPVGGSSGGSSAAASSAAPASSAAASAAPASSEAAAAPAPSAEASAPSSSATPSSTSAAAVVNSVVNNQQASVPTTLVTVQIITADSGSTGTPTVLSASSTAASPTFSAPSGPCPTGAWQCSGSVLEQCLDDNWTYRFTCPDGLICQGGDTPYCAPPGFN